MIEARCGQGQRCCWWCDQSRLLQLGKARCCSKAKSKISIVCYNCAGFFLQGRPQYLSFLVILATQEPSWSSFWSLLSLRHCLQWRSLCGLYHSRTWNELSLRAWCYPSRSLMLLKLVVGFLVDLCGEDNDGNGCIHLLHISLSICSLDLRHLGLNMKNTDFRIFRTRFFTWLGMLIVSCNGDLLCIFPTVHSWLWLSYAYSCIHLSLTLTGWLKILVYFTYILFYLYCMYTLLLIVVVIPLILLSPDKLIRSSLHLLELTVCFLITCQYSVIYNWTEFLELTQKFRIAM